MLSLLIGINHYESDGIKDLEGCVNDIEYISTYLQHCLKVPPQSITTLLSPSSNTTPNNMISKTPTLKHIIEALELLIKSAKENESILVHFSGHGTRVPTTHPEFKSNNPLDEALVTMDDTLYTRKLLRDVELDGYLKQMAARKQMYSWYSTAVIREELHD
ncbi:hypothetical protein BP5796_12587 [Coleophoma crateriformis]|uniref:Peptidase C14 caspase domain-containing protein n=1 Tax=Coleophoma crateriformis TaxID=565419 RepID=A0A3D8Q7H5_9HELO|nr:hypothetical protein BP5796_12587 [Coleophoma crateriformis]